MILGVDPGLDGAVVALDGEAFECRIMPTKEIGDTREIDFDRFRLILTGYPGAHIFLERAMPMAMGSKHAFNYGRGFAALEIAVHLEMMPVTYVEPAKWTKVMHEGISNDLKPKAKSVIAAERLFPSLMSQIPRSKKGKYHDGVIDALLVAGFGVRQMARTS